MHLSPLSSNFFLISSRICAYATQPKILKWETYVSYQSKLPKGFYLLLLLLELCSECKLKMQQPHPEFFRQPLKFDNTSDHIHYCSVLSLCYSILLRSIPGCELSIDTVFPAIFYKFGGVILTSSIIYEPLIYLPLYFSTRALNSLNFSKVPHLFTKKIHVYML